MTGGVVIPVTYYCGIIIDIIIGVYYIVLTNNGRITVTTPMPILTYMMRIIFGANGVL